MQATNCSNSGVPFAASHPSWADFDNRLREFVVLPEVFDTPASDAVFAAFGRSRRTFHQPALALGDRAARSP